jgi:hypothetical protein
MGDGGVRADGVVLDADVPVQDEPPVRYAMTTYGRYAQPPTRDLHHLGPILPACPACGDLRYWHAQAVDVWQCWTCVPPTLRTAVAVKEV